MVRSNGEHNREFFHLVEPIRSEDKYFNYGRLEVCNTIDSDGAADLEADVETASEHGVVTVPLRLYFKRRRKYWSVALLLHGIRIDGIDWLPSFPCEDGSQGTGWHRHRWQPDEMNADVHEPLPPSFGAGLVDVEDFVNRISSEMRISWSAKDVGFNGRLPLA